jgi:2-polyprenyl-3-methyl-5-hydroxy-6-metoxy-1,4-benzoquinol methylase
MANARGKEVDRTYLSIDQAEERGFIHRDYIAHCLRWSHVCKVLMQKHAYKTARILDIGCGRELPMAKMLYSSKMIPQTYYGVDVGPVNDEDLNIIAKTGKFPHTVWERTNLLDLEEECFTHEFPNIVTCFEVLEHVEPAMMMDMLEHMKLLTTDDCRFFISTPVWNRTDCAANHVNEMLYESLGAAFERHGFVITNVHGTFASIRDYEPQLLDAKLSTPVDHNYGLPTRQLFERLREYYDTNFLSCVFAPLFPERSRNCLWELRKFTGGPDEEIVNKFPFIRDIEQPWSSSTKWEDMAL